MVAFLSRSLVRQGHISYTAHKKRTLSLSNITLNLIHTEESLSKVSFHFALKIWGINWAKRARASCNFDDWSARTASQTSGCRPWWGLYIWKANWIDLYLFYLNLFKHIEWSTETKQGSSTRGDDYQAQGGDDLLRSAADLLQDGSAEHQGLRSVENLGWGCGQLAPLLAWHRLDAQTLWSLGPLSQHQSQSQSCHHHHCCSRQTRSMHQDHLHPASMDGSNI